MSDSTSGGRTLALFLVFSTIGAVAAVPFMGRLTDRSKPAAASEELPIEPATVAEPPPPVAKPARTAAPRRTVKTKWTGGGSTSSGSASASGASRPTPVYTGARPLPPARGKTVIEVQGYRDPSGGITFTARKTIQR